MHHRQWFLLAALAAALAGNAPAQSVTAGIDATRTAQPIAKLVFGGFMEPATTRVWAEMLYDRKFLIEINSKPQPAAPSGGFGRRGPQPRWMPVGADESITMDSRDAYVGEWSPLTHVGVPAVHR